jgi:CBS domain-containing protein
MSIKITSIIEKDVATMDEEETALDAARAMAKMYVGSIIAKKGEKVTGLFTERDMITKIIAAGLEPAKVLLKDAMVRDYVIVGPEATCQQCIKLMKKYRCRHLTVFDNDKFVGIVSLRDMVALMIEEKGLLVEKLKGYIDEPGEE